MYLTQQEMTERFGETELIQLTDRAIPPAGVVDAAVLTRALEDAGAEVDAYLQGRFALPLAAVPMVLKRIAADMARFRLYENRATEEVRDRYKNALRDLERIRDGKINLGLDAAGEASPERGSVGLSAAPRTFSHDTLSDY